MQILISGGAGFIGSNLAARGIRLGHSITIIDNLSRMGGKLNLEWLHSLGSFEFIQDDISNFDSIRNLFESETFDAVYHVAGQVAVTTSIENPRVDFESNALGTLNLLEAIRITGQNPIFIFSSTNKVYGSCSSIDVIEKNGRYALKDLPDGVPEMTPLDFHSPYGCSKGAADQYVLDYRRIYGLKTIVFRQSCIYGPRQMGVEDQGWVAWFSIAAALGRPITIYGDGRQVRDLLYIDDLVDLYYNATEFEPYLTTNVFNVGGGPGQAASLLDVISILERKISDSIELHYSDWRPGDQRVYVSSINSLQEQFKWAPKISPSDGIGSLLEWTRQNQHIWK